MSSTLKNIFKFLLFGGAGFLILYFTYKKTDKAYLAECALKGIPEDECSLLEKLWLDISSAHVEWIIVVVALFLISNISRTLRWQMLLEPLGYVTKFANGFFSIMLGYFANLGLPRMGEVVRITIFAKYENIPVEQVTGTWAVDRTIDVLSMLLIMGLAFLLEFDLIWNAIIEAGGDGSFVQILLIVGVLGLFGLVTLWAYRKMIQQSAIYARVEKLILGFIDGIKTVGQLKRPWLFVLHSVIIWLAYYLMTYLCFFAFDPTANLTASAGLVVFVFGALGIVFPSPGGMGTYHAMIIIGLAIYGISEEDAFSFANILFLAINLFCNISFGLVALFALPFLNQKKKRIA